MIDMSVERVIDASRETVWDKYTDHAGWTDWAGVGKVTLAREGDSERNGVGCIRVISNPGQEVHEEVIVYEAPSRMIYRVCGGNVPIRNHEGEVRMEESGGGTLVKWHVRFEPTIPFTGFLIRCLFTFVFSRLLRRLEATV